MFHVQFDENTGVIVGTNGPRFDDKKPEPPPGIGQLDLPDWVDTNGKRVNVVMQIVEDDPVFARDQARQAVLLQLVELDGKRPRAMTDVLLSGDKTALQGIEDKAADLRKQLAAIP